MRKRLLITSTVLAVSLAGCGAGSDNPEPEQPAHEETGDHNSEHHHGDHSSSGEVPEGLKEADNPSYPVGSKATMEANHMPGMKGTEATIVGAYTTTAYAVSYTPTTGKLLSKTINGSYTKSWKVMKMRLMPLAILSC